MNRRPLSDRAPVRRAAPVDEAAVAAIARQAYAPFVAAIGRKPAPMLADFAAQIEAGHVHVAEADDGSVAGFVVAFARGDHLFIENIAVRPAAQGTGLGGRLMRFCETLARRQGLAAIELYTNAAMTANLALYPHLGFVRTGRRTEDGFDRVYFRKVLD